MLLAVLAGVAGAGGSSSAAPHELVLDPDASELTFTLDSTLHRVHGSLALTGGRVTFDLETREARGTIVVDATAADTGHRRRDEKMHAKVLESRRFPEIVFRAEAIEGRLGEDGTGQVELRGTVEIHGETAPFVFPASVRLREERLEAVSEVEVPYVDWGMKDPSFLMLRAAKVVQVRIVAKGRVAAAGSRP